MLSHVKGPTRPLLFGAHLMLCEMMCTSSFSAGVSIYRMIHSVCQGCWVHLWRSSRGAEIHSQRRGKATSQRLDQVLLPVLPISAPSFLFPVKWPRTQGTWVNENTHGYLKVFTQSPYHSFSVPWSLLFSMSVEVEVVSAVSAPH